MRSEGNTGQAITSTNDTPFHGFATTSGRDILSDLERARRKHSPIKLAPLAPAAERALISEGRRERKQAGPARSRAPRKPAKPARLPAPGPRIPAQRPVRPPATPGPSRARRGQTSNPVRDQVLAAHQAGLTVTEIRIELEVSDPTVRRHLRDAGLTPHRKSRLQFDPAQLVACYLAGYSVPATAEMFGCSRRIVREALGRYHVVRRDDVTVHGHKPRATAASQLITDPPRIGQDVADLYHAGVTVPSQIARQLGVSWATVQRHLARAGLSGVDGRRVASRQRRPDLQIDIVKTLYAEPMTCAEIAEDLGTTPKTIREMLRRSGIELRDDRSTNSGSKPKSYDAALIATVRRLYESGMNQLEVAQYCKVGTHVVQRIMDRYGIDSREAKARPHRAGDHAEEHRAHVEYLGGASVIREWADRNGVPCPRVGTPPMAVVDAYLDAVERKANRHTPHAEQAAG